MVICYLRFCLKFMEILYVECRMNLTETAVCFMSWWFIVWVSGLKIMSIAGTL